MSLFGGLAKKWKLVNTKLTLPNRKLGTGEDLIEGHVPAGQGRYVAAPYNHPWTGNLVRIPQGWLNPPYALSGSFIFGKAQAGGNSGVQFMAYQPQRTSGYKLPNQAQQNGYVYAGAPSLLQGLGQFQSETQDSSMGG